MAKPVELCYHQSIKTQNKGGSDHETKHPSAGAGSGRDPAQRRKTHHPPHPGGFRAGQGTGGASRAGDGAACPGPAPGRLRPARSALCRDLQRGHHPGLAGGPLFAGKAPHPGRLPGRVGAVCGLRHDPPGLPGGGGLSLPDGLRHPESPLCGDGDAGVSSQHPEDLAGDRRGVPDPG